MFKKFRKNEIVITKEIQEITNKIKIESDLTLKLNKQASEILHKIELKNEVSLNTQALNFMLDYQKHNNNNLIEYINLLKSLV